MTYCKILKINNLNNRVMWQPKFIKTKYDIDHKFLFEESRADDHMYFNKKFIPII